MSFDEAAITVGTGPNHGYFLITIGNSYQNFVDGYSPTSDERVIYLPETTAGQTITLYSTSIPSFRSSGNVLRFKQLQLFSTSTEEQRIEYTYDGLSRLTRAEYYDDGPLLTALERSYQYAYDQAGNRTQEIAFDGLTTTTTEYDYTVDDGGNDKVINQLQRHRVDGGSWVNYTYDANGNMVNTPTGSYEWDRANRLTGLNSSFEPGFEYGDYTYTYDGLGNRVKEQKFGDTGNFERTLLNDLQGGLTRLLSKTNVWTSQPEAYYLHGPRGIHAQQNVPGDWMYFIQDGLGSVRAQVSATPEAGVAATQGYAPYGSVIDRQGTFDTEFGFTGEQSARYPDPLLYLRARYYSPNSGVFTALDPYEGTMQRPMSLNGYSWVEGNVINATDPSGLCSNTQPRLFRPRCRELARSLSRRYNIPLENLINENYEDLLVFEGAARLNDAATLPRLAISEDPQLVIAAVGRYVAQLFNSGGCNSTLHGGASIAIPNTGGRSSSGRLPVRGMIVGGAIGIGIGLGIGALLGVNALNRTLTQDDTREDDDADCNYGVDDASIALFYAGIAQGYWLLVQHQTKFVASQRMRHSPGKNGRKDHASETIQGNLDARGT